MQKHSQAPHRRIQAEIHIGADNWDELENTVREIAREIQSVKIADENLYWVSNGENAGADLSIKVDHAMTREQYCRDLQNWQAEILKGENDEKSVN